MKSKRHAKILEIIKTYPINTQEELLRHLNESGFNVTQATVSRDIKELRLIKSLDSNGNYHYSTIQQESENLSSKFYTLFADTVTNIDYAGNIVVIKCLSGMASAVCAALDSLNRPDIVGTISGDDTFICIMRNENYSMELYKELKKLIKND
ncbi:MAG TPA: arginine repressor [Candidatus Avimonas sp.]|nr:arginine repressor [Clostridiales bacterium]HPU58445.1 arginine repressor [Candidatus Avimonas sp.]